jgi:hypothetical protein
MVRRRSTVRFRKGLSARSDLRICPSQSGLRAGRAWKDITGAGVFARPVVMLVTCGDAWLAVSARAASASVDQISCFSCYEVRGNLLAESAAGRCDVAFGDLRW